MKICKTTKPESIEILKQLWNVGMHLKILTKSEKIQDLVYQIDANKYSVHSYKELKWYRCRKCGKITIYNITNSYPTNECNGTLVECDPDEVYKENYYRNEYMNKFIEKIIIKEHTSIKPRKSKRLSKEFQKAKY